MVPSVLNYRSFLPHVSNVLSFPRLSCSLSSSTFPWKIVSSQLCHHWSRSVKICFMLVTKYLVTASAILIVYSLFWTIWRVWTLSWVSQQPVLRCRSTINNYCHFTLVIRGVHNWSYQQPLNDLTSTWYIRKYDITWYCIKYDNYLIGDNKKHRKQKRKCLRNSFEEVWWI